MPRERVSRKRPIACVLLRFVVWFVAAMSAVSLLWPFIAPGYATGATCIARPIFRLVEHPDVTVLNVEDSAIWIYRIVGPGTVEPVVWFDQYTFFAMVPLVALFVATPGLAWAQRVVRMTIGWLLLVGIQVAYLVASTELLYAAETGALNGLQTLVRVLWEAAPVFIWGALTLGRWREVLGSLRAATAEARGERPPRMKAARAQG